MRWNLRNRPSLLIHIVEILTNHTKGKKKFSPMMSVYVQNEQKEIEQVGKFNIKNESILVSVPGLKPEIQNDKKSIMEKFVNIYFGRLYWIVDVNDYPIMTMLATDNSFNNLSNLSANIFERRDCKIDLKKINQQNAVEST